MKKKIVAFAMAVVFALCTAGMSFAAKITCKIEGVDGDKVTMTCEDAGKVAPGDKVKVSLPRKGGIEGC